MSGSPDLIRTPVFLVFMDRLCRDVSYILTFTDSLPTRMMYMQEGSVQESMPVCQSK